MSFIPFEFIPTSKSQTIQIQELRGSGGKRSCASNWHSGSIFADSRPPFHFRNILLKNYIFTIKKHFVPLLGPCRHSPIDLKKLTNGNPACRRYFLASASSCGCL